MPVRLNEAQKAKRNGHVQVNTNRNQAISIEWQLGMPVSVLSNKYSLSKTEIRRIVQKIGFDRDFYVNQSERKMLPKEAEFLRMLAGM